MTITTEVPVVGVFAERSEAQQAIESLLRAGFKEGQIGVVSHDARVVVTAGAPGPSIAELSPEAGGAAGALPGVRVVGLWTVSIAAGMIPGIGPVIAGGFLASPLANAVAGAAADSLVAAMIGMGASEDDARRYEGELRAGRTIVIVQTNERRSEVIQTLRQHGADHFRWTGEEPPTQSRSPREEKA